MKLNQVMFAGKVAAPNIVTWRSDTYVESEEVDSISTNDSDVYNNLKFGIDEVGI